MSYKVAQITGMFSASGGGAPRSVADQIAAVQSQGVQVTLFTGYSEEFPLTPDAFDLGDCEIVSGPLLGHSYLGYAPSVLKQLAARAAEFDVIHLNGVWHLTAVIGARIARRAGVPYIVTGHSHLGQYHYSRHAMIKKALHHLLIKKVIRGAARIHVTAEWEKSTSIHAIGNTPIVKIPLAVDLSPLLPPMPRGEARRHLGLSDDGFHVVSFGRLAQQKNPLFLLDAFRTADLPAGSKLVFVGPPEQAVKTEVLRIARDAGIANRVTVIDYASGLDRKAWLSAGDLFALPTHDDNFCISAIESAASGTHCVLSPHVGAYEYIPDDLVDVIPLEMAEWALTLERHARSRPQQNPPPDTFRLQFKAETIGKKWINVYGSILNLQPRM